MISELEARVNQARVLAHQEHLRTRSDAAHRALGAFYGQLVGAFDAVAENYIAMFGPFEASEVTVTPGVDMPTYLQEEADWIETNRDEISQGSSSIGNMVDTLTSVYTQTIFLLRLK